MRPGCDQLPHLSREWVHSFKRRHNLGRLQVASSDRPADNALDMAADNSWRASLNGVFHPIQITGLCFAFAADLLKNPAEYGLPTTGPQPPGLTLAGDETPICYLPKSKVLNPLGARRVYFPTDRRQITGTPIVALDGTCVLFQLIWRGTTTACHPRGPAIDSDPRLYHTHSVRKCQTRQTFLELLERIDRVVQPELCLLPPFFQSSRVLKHSSACNLQVLPSFLLWTMCPAILVTSCWRLLKGLTQRKVTT